MIIQNLEAGLCNRLRAIHSAHILALELRRGHHLHWPVDDSLGAAFEELFDPCAHLQVNSSLAVAVSRIHESGRRSGRALRRILFQQPLLISLENIDDLYFYTKYNGERKPIPKEMRRCAMIYIKTIHSFLYGMPINYLRPVPVTMKKIGKVIDRMRGAKTVGVHIRRGDHARSIAESPLDLFFGKIHQRLNADKNTKFFLATDCEITRIKLSNEFGSKIVFYEGAEFRRDTVEGVRSAVVDLWCLSQCMEIYASSGSSFSQMACSLGGSPLTTIKSAKVSGHIVVE